MLEYEQALDYFIETVVSSGRYYPTEGFEYLDHSIIHEIEDILNSSCDSAAERKIRKLLKKHKVGNDAS